MKSLRSFASSMAVIGALLGSLLAESSASAQSTIYRGFAVNRCEPTSAGEWSFWLIILVFLDPPFCGRNHLELRAQPTGLDWSAATEASRPGSRSSNTSSLVMSIWLDRFDRVQINASVPITFPERGTRPQAQNQPAVLPRVIRLGFWVRLFGQPYKSAVSLSLGAQVWVPMRSFGPTSGVALSSSDEGVLRVLPKLALGGYGKHILWSFTAGFQYRPLHRSAPESILRVVRWARNSSSVRRFPVPIFERRFAVGPEAVLATQVLGTDSTKPFYRDYTSLEVLLAAHYNIARQVNLGVAGGIGILRQPGTPDGRVLLRLAYAPMKEERSRSSIVITTEFWTKTMPVRMKWASPALIQIPTAVQIATAMV